MTDTTEYIDFYECVGCGEEFEGEEGAMTVVLYPATMIDPAEYGDLCEECAAIEADHAI